MDDWILILSNKRYRTLSTNEITWLLTKRIIKRSKMSLMKQKCHWRYCVNFLISKCTSLNWQSHTFNRWIENFIDGFYRFLNQYISNISNIYNSNVNMSLASQTKCDNMISDPGVGSYIFTFPPSYVPGLCIFLLVCVKYPLNLKRGRCRNLL